MRISRDSFANFVADFRTTFVRVSRECRENFHVSRTCREGFRQNISQDCRATVLSNRANTSRLSGEKIKLIDIRTNVVRHSHECRATVV